MIHDVTLCTEWLLLYVSTTGNGPTFHWSLIPHSVTVTLTCLFYSRGIVILESFPVLNRLHLKTQLRSVPELNTFQA